MPVVAIVTHLVQPGRMQEGADRINANGARMAGRPGFISRQVLAPLDGSEQLITVTQWADEASYRDWVAHNTASARWAGLLICSSSGRRVFACFRSHISSWPAPAWKKPRSARSSRAA